MSTHGGTVAPLTEALTALRAAVTDTTYPLDLPSAPEAHRTRAALVGQVDDYLLPRIERLDAPVLVVVGGSTGAGKSTLVNSLVQAPVSAAGVLRPTTRAPVLVSHPSDTPWYRAHLLPGLVRTSAAPRTPDSLQLVAAHALTPGLALLDAPDIDSVVQSNRSLAGQLLAAADLWLFVTTAARYADAVPWDLLASARERGVAIALLLDRVNPESAAEVAAHFTQMLASAGFGGVPLFVVPETAVDGQGLLPDPAVATLRQWIGDLARDGHTRDAVVRQTLAGALAALGPAVAGLAAAADDQVDAAQALSLRVRVAYSSALSQVDAGLRDGALLRGEVPARWQRLVGVSGLLDALESPFGRLRDRVEAALAGRAAPGDDLRVALESSLSALIRAAVTDAAEQAAVAWQAHPAGAAVLTAARTGAGGAPVDLARPGEDLTGRVDRLIQDWRQGVLARVRGESAGRRGATSVGVGTVIPTGLLVMVGACTATPPGVRLPFLGGTPAPRPVLELIVDDPALRDLTQAARRDLLTRVETLLDGEEQRFLDRIVAAGLQEDQAERLRTTIRAVAWAAVTSGLTPPAVPALAGIGLPGVATTPAPFTPTESAQLLDSAPFAESEPLAESEPVTGSEPAAIPAQAAGPDDAAVDLDGWPDDPPTPGAATSREPVAPIPRGAS